MAASPLSSKGVVFLLSLLYLQAQSVGATISTSTGFPQDVFAKPAFGVSISLSDKDATVLPIKRSDAINILEQQEASSSSTSNHAFAVTPSDVAALAVPSNTQQNDLGSSSDSSRTLFYSLQRTSPEDFQLCSVPDFTYKSPDKPSSHRSTSTSSSRSRQELLQHAQALLEPLKKKCLYHTFDWFTYSFCHGREIRQFRRLGPQTAAQKAFKAAGGGEAGEKAAVEAALKVNGVNHPIADPEYPAFILGRWTPQNEDIVGDDRSHQRHQQQPLHTSTDESPTGVALFSSDRPAPSLGSGAGLDLVEEVQFGDWDEEELFAAEAKALAQFEDPQNDIVEASPHVSGSAGHESQRHRYVTQKWGNGTMCDMNHQPRSIEVQFHCSNRPPAEDRIVMFKETTICNYVLIVETPRLCADPAFGSEKEELPLPIQCHKVVDDTYPGPTLGDPQKVPTPPFGELQSNEVAAKQEQSKASTTENDFTSTKEEVKQATTTSHTYGDLSRYGSVYDDYFDEALGGHGALYDQLDHEHEHEHEHENVHEHQREHGHDLAGEEAEVLVEIGIDEDGKPFVNKVVQSPSTSGDGSAKEVRRKESGKRRSDDDDTHADAEADRIELNVDDFLSVLRGDEGGSLEKKIADKITQMLNKQQETEISPADQGKNGDVRGKEKKQTPNDVADLYKKLLGAFNGDGHPQGGKEGKFGKAGQQKSPPQMRMEKVGDSLSERAKRFYESKGRAEDVSKKEKKESSSAPPIEQHLEL